VRLRLATKPLKGITSAVSSRRRFRGSGRSCLRSVFKEPDAVQRQVADADSFTFRSQGRLKPFAFFHPPGRQVESPVDAAIEKNGLRVSAQGTGNLVLRVVSVKRKKAKRPTHTVQRLMTQGSLCEGGVAPRPAREPLCGPRLHKSNKRNTSDDQHGEIPLESPAAASSRTKSLWENKVERLRTTSIPRKWDRGPLRHGKTTARPSTFQPPLAPSPGLPRRVGARPEGSAPEGIRVIPPRTARPWSNDRTRIRPRINRKWTVTPPPSHP